MNDESLSDFNLIRMQLRLKPEQIDFLKTIDKDNVSNALRILIDRYIKQTKMMKFDRFLLYFVFLVCIIIFVILLLPVLGL